MAKSIFGLKIANTDAATFRAWGSALSAQIGAVLTRVAQTGDINWSTVAAPTASSYAGFEVYSFNDTLQATAPLFIKFEYGAQSTVTNIQIRATVGKSADGSGNIGGVLMSPTVVFAAQTEGTVVENCYVCGIGSTFAFSLNPVSTFRGGYFMIERAVTSGGVPIADALLIGYQTAASLSPMHLFIDYDAVTVETVSGGIIAIPLALAADRSIANGTTAPIFPAACISPAGVYWRPRVILGTARQNAGLGEVITGMIDGNTYLSLGAGSQKSDQRGGAFATTMIRWD